MVKKSKKRFSTKIIMSLFILILAFSLAGCSSDSSSNPSGDTASSGEGPVAIIEMESGGVIEVQLDSEAAPLSVENFVKLAKEGFYDGMIFHRIISGFMIQGGGYDADVNEKPAENVKGEFSSNGWENNISHKRGVISMARTPIPDSASSQFFIVHEDSPFLDGDYAGFGEVISGMEVVDDIASVETDDNDMPLENVVIKTIRIE